MYKITSFVTGDHIEAICRMGARDLLYCVLEANEKDPTQFESGFLSQLLTNAVYRACKEQNKDVLPLEIANCLRYELERLSTAGLNHYGVLYAGVFIRPGIIQLSTVGDIRIHLVKNDTVINVTRDHNLMSDPPIDRLDTIKSLPTNLLLETLTRVIEINERKTPETKIWEIAGNFSIILCTSQFHRYREPTQYLTLPDYSISSLEATALGNAWLFTKIDGLQE